MSARSDLVREPFEKGFDPERARDNTAEDAVLYAPGVGPEIRGRDAIIDVLTKFWAENDPQYRVVGEAEHGSFVVLFLEATIGGRNFELSNTYLFDETDKLRGLWAIRA